MKNIYIFLILTFLPLSAYAHSLTDAQQDYLLGDYVEALSKARGVRVSDESLYFLGLANIKLGHYVKARDCLRKLITRFPNSGLWAQGAVKLADSYFLEKNYLKAEKIYKEIMKESFSLNIMSIVYLRLAQVAGKQGNWEERNKYLELIKKEYPQSLEMKFVDTLEDYGDFFTVQVGAFSEKNNALSIVNDLADKYKPYIVEEAKSGYPIYKVRVGRYKRLYQAREVYLELKDQGYPARIYP
ncbi:MAG: tetratricopeptide repeat protein [Candidatus Omnitrophota bacterium]